MGVPQGQHVLKYDWVIKIMGGDHKRKFDCNSVSICFDLLSSSEILIIQKNTWPESTATAAIISSFASSEIFLRTCFFITQTTTVKHPKRQNDRMSWSCLSSLCSIVSWSDCFTGNEVLDIILKQTSKLVSPGNVYMNRHQQFWNLWISEDSDFIKIELTQIWLWWNWMLA